MFLAKRHMHAPTDRFHNDHTVGNHFVGNLSVSLSLPLSRSHSVPSPIIHYSQPETYFSLAILDLIYEYQFSGHRKGVGRDVHQRAHGGRAAEVGWGRGEDGGRDFQVPKRVWG